MCIADLPQVVLMNQVTTRIMEDQTSKLVPALGEWVSKRGRTLVSIRDVKKRTGGRVFCQVEEACNSRRWQVLR